MKLTDGKFYVLVIQLIPGSYPAEHVPGKRQLGTDTAASIEECGRISLRDHVGYGHHLPYLRQWRRRLAPVAGVGVQETLAPYPFRLPVLEVVEVILRHHASSSPSTCRLASAELPDR